MLFSLCDGQLIVQLDSEVFLAMLFNLWWIYLLLMLLNLLLRVHFLHPKYNMVFLFILRLLWGRK